MGFRFIDILNKPVGRIRIGEELELAEEVGRSVIIFKSIASYA